MFLNAASVTALMVLAVPPVAAEELPRECTSSGGAFRIEVIQGPCAVDNENAPDCAVTGAFTGIRYRITGNPDHVAVLVKKGNVVSTATGNIVYGLGAGDTTTGLGKHSQHERAVKFGSGYSSGEFWLVVEGEKLPSLETILAKKGTNRAEPCAIVGLGDDGIREEPSEDGCVRACGNFHPDQLLKKAEILTFKGCSVMFTYDLFTGQVVDAHLTGESAECDFFTANVSDLSLTLNVEGGGPLGLGTIGDGYISTGSDSCTSRVISGRLYTWGNPCPN